MAQPVEHEALSVPDGRSGCPVIMTRELLGDRWSLIVLRDVMFGGRTRFRELLGHSLEGVASKVLASRLAKVTDAGLLSRHAVPGHRQKIDDFLTDAAIELVPVIIEIGSWGARWLPYAETDHSRPTRRRRRTRHGACTPWNRLDPSGDDPIAKCEPGRPDRAGGHHLDHSENLRAALSDALHITGTKHGRTQSSTAHLIGSSVLLPER